MKGSLILLAWFALGILAGYSGWVPEAVAGEEKLALYALYVLIFLVGICVGGDTRALRNILRLKARGLAVPLVAGLGSLLGAGALALALDAVSLREGCAVGAGLGYYSLASVLASQLGGAQLGGITLLANLLREVLTIALTPLMVRSMGELAPIAAGGATTMDTTLGVIHRQVGASYAVIAVINGLVLSLLVPVLIPLLLG
ncbi:MAG: lysine exporter LysO family protein [Desulfohalobiaceae bacterium]|nr:lysine exporter LysO family protein [Desulfohalobiaceae bacterium]